MSLKRLLLQLGAGGVLGIAALAFAFGQSEDTVQACGAAGPFDFDTYEADDFRSVYAKAIELATAGKAITFDYTLSSGDRIDLRYQGLQQGPRSARVTSLNTALAIPPTVYKSIAWIEANWGNASTPVPYGGVGPVLRSFDCGYGIGQITSGMQNANGTATGRQAIIGTHFLFNMAEGVRILADKWNTAPQYRPIAGNGNPAMLEDWYYATWSYNGFAFSNHPLNPTRDPLRGGGVSPIYHCFDPSAPSYQTNSEGGVIYGYGSYTYPERVYGCVRYPPNYYGGRLWASQAFNMPDFNLPEIAAAFAPQHFLNCEEAGFSGGCPSMDYPTTIQREGVNVTPHADTTPPRNAAEAASLIGDPRFSYSGPSTMSLTGYSDGTSSTGRVTVSNTGTFIGPYRIRTSHPWIIVRHPGDPASRSLDGGVVVGRETEVVITGTPRKTQPGYSSVLEVSVAPRVMPPGVSTGTVWIEPLLGTGSNFKIDIIAANGASNFGHKRVVPGLASDP